MQAASGVYSNRCTRWFTVSATKTVPLPSMAIPRGVLNWPSSPPLLPQVATWAPAASSFWRRWVRRIGDGDVPRSVGGNALRLLELTVERALSTPGGREHGAQLELLDPVGVPMGTPDEVAERLAEILVASPS